ncbi:MAG: hypothetical protein A2X94_12065 [Bdellovibrionales bacterium GWB1_55_8]|nr:MAG: hypothetical protein A2X94_12065 [Bdellovibrionales bacterium GWB1_55_8]
MRRIVVLIILVCGLWSAEVLATGDVEYSTYTHCLDELQMTHPEVHPDFSFAEEPRTFPATAQSSEGTCCRGPAADFQEVQPLARFFGDEIEEVHRRLLLQDSENSPVLGNQLRSANRSLRSCEARADILHKKALEAAENVYDLKAPPGYSLNPSDVFSFPDSGIKAYLVRPNEPNPKNLPPVIAFTGTESLQDAVQDMSLGADQLNNAKIRFYQWLYAIQKEKFREIIITGHSLGGGLAQGAAALIPDDIRLKVHLVTFNGFGGRDMNKAFHSIYKSEFKDRDFKEFQPTRHAVNYRMKYDPVSLIGVHYGHVRTIESSNNPLQVVKNHVIGTIRASVSENPAALLESKVKESSTWVRPLSATARGVALLKSVNRRVTDALGQLAPDKTCKEPFAYEAGMTSCKQGNALDCFGLGQKAKDENEIRRAMELYEQGCESCHLESCVQYAVLNKIVGYQDKSLKIAKLGCDLGDGSSCIEAGEIIAEDEKKAHTSDKYVFLGCAHGQQSLCKRIPNPHLAKEYLRYARTACAHSSLDECELYSIIRTPKNVDPKAGLARARELLKNGVSPKTKYGSSTALEAAAASGKLEIVKLLLSNMKASDKEVKQQKVNALAAAILVKENDIAKLILSNGVRVNGKDRRGNTPLYIAAREHNAEMVGYLPNYGAVESSAESLALDKMVAAAEGRGTSGNGDPLGAVQAGLLGSLKRSLEKGGDPNIQDHLGNTPLHIAAGDGRADLVKALLSHPATVLSRNHDGETALTRAAQFGRHEVVKLLLERDAASGYPNSKDEMNLFAAAKGGNAKIFEQIRKLGSSMDWRNQYGETILHAAAYGDNNEILRAVLESKSESGAPLIRTNTPDSEGITPLHVAALHGNLEAVKILIKHGANLTIRDRSGASILERAVASGSLQTVAYLVESGAPIDHRSFSMASAYKKNIGRYLQQRHTPYRVLENNAQVD